MATVYQGRQLAVDRQVAVKILELPSVGPRDRALAQRFELEAQAMSRLEHPHTVRVYDYGDTGDGLRYLVLEQCRGPTLKTIIERLGPLEPARAARLGAQICKALSEAHAHGIVHRDLKPGNVFVVTFHGEEDFAKVGDFGIAKLVGPESTPTITRTGDAVGTPAYMPPEQAVGEVVGTSADLYALGGLLYAALCGRPPYEGENGMIVMYMHVHQPPPTLDLPGAPEAIRTAWQALLNRLLAKTPAGRPGSAAVTAAALQELAAAGSDAPTGAWTSPLLTAPTSGSSPFVGPPDETDPRTVFSVDELSRGAAVTRTEPPGKPPHRPAFWLAAGGLVTAASLVAVALATGSPAVESAPTSLPLHAPEATGAAPDSVPPPPLADVPDVELLTVALPPVEEDSATGDIPSDTHSPDAGEDPTRMRIKALGMVYVPPDRYPIGCDASEPGCDNDARPRRVVPLPAFGVDRTEVSVSAYAQCVESGNCAKPQAGRHCSYGRPNAKNVPMNCVSQAEAKAYCSAEGRRLPTELEWEAAARSVDGHPWPWGPERPDCTRTVMDDGGPGCGRGSAADVGTTPGDRSPLGVLDMAGNVREWTDSAYRPYPGGHAASLQGGFRAGGFVTRGSGWVESASEVGASYRRLAERDAEARHADLGFRCVVGPEGLP